VSHLSLSRSLSLSLSLALSLSLSLSLLRRIFTHYHNLEHMTDALENFMAAPPPRATSQNGKEHPSPDKKGVDKGLESDEAEKDFDFEEDALVIGSAGSLPNSFKDEFDFGHGAKSRHRGHHQHTRQESSGDEFESLGRETIGSPDGDNELGMPAGSVFLG